MVSCSSLGVGASVQLTIGRVLSVGASIQWELQKNSFLDSRKLELYFQLELHIKQLLDNHSGGFCPEVGFHLKNCVHFCSFFLLLSLYKQ